VIKIRENQFLSQEWLAKMNHKIKSSPLKFKKILNNSVDDFETLVFGLF
jgi:hypothetical protein